MTNSALVRLTLFTLAGLALLVGLGVWQLDRLEWKEGLIARIEARTKQEPITLEEAIAIVREDGDASYYRVRVTGRFNHDLERYLYALSFDGAPGWHVITPLETAGGEIVLVDRGFVPNALRDPSSRALGQIGDVVMVTGLVRMPETAGLFVPDNEVEANRWFFRDLSAMARSMFGRGAGEVAPFFLEAEAGAVPGGWPEGGQTRLEIPNNHLQYALTWFGLALCLLVVYAVYVWGQYRGERG